MTTTSTSTFMAKTSTSCKAYLHKPIPDNLFPHGYLVGGVHSGIKKDASALDLTVLLSSSSSWRQTSAAASFTCNVFQAAPMMVSKDVLRQTLGRARALIVNSGCANVVMGCQGLTDAGAMARATDALVLSSSSPPSSSETLVMSTGVIDQVLPISKILTVLHPQGPLSTALSQSFTA